MKKLFENTDRTLIFDGSKGVMLQNMGLQGHEAAEEWNLSHKEEVKTVYREYVKAGADVIQTNTFPGNAITLKKHGLIDKVYELNLEGVRLAKEEIGDKALIAAAVGATGEFLEPAGTLTFDECVDSFKEQMRAIYEAGADLVSFETFTDLNELRAAILALKSTCDLPFIATMSFEPGGRTLSGNPAECAAIMCEGLGAKMTGANCSGGPESLLEPIKKMNEVSNLPLVVKPNAGLPETVDGKTVYPMESHGFVPFVKEFIENGVRLIGGCCGALPAHIAAIKEKADSVANCELRHSGENFISSAYSFVSTKNIEADTVKIDGSGDIDDITEELADCEGDAVIIEMGEDCRDFDFSELMCSLSLSVRTPLIIKTEDEVVLKKFLTYYPGRAGAIVPKALTETVLFFGAAVL